MPRMNRRTLLTSLAALGLVAATPEPVRRFWALDQTMVPKRISLWDAIDPIEPPEGWWVSQRFDAGMVAPHQYADAYWLIERPNYEFARIPAVMEDGMWTYRGEDGEIVHSLSATVIPSTATFTFTNVWVNDPPETRVIL